MALSKEELVLSESDLSFMVSFLFSPPPPHSAKSVYALKMLDVVILKLVGFFFCFLYMWQVLRSQKNAPNPFACFTNGKMMFSVLFYFVLNSEDDEG